MSFVANALSRRLERQVLPDDFLLLTPDTLFFGDALGGHVLEQVGALPGVPVFNTQQVHATCGRNFPPRDVASANAFRAYTTRVHKSGITFHGPAQAGVLHHVLAENVTLAAGNVVLGTDSHTLALGAFGCLALGVGVEDMVAALRYGKTWFKMPRVFRVCLSGRPAAPVTARDGMFTLMAALQQSVVGQLVEFWDCTDDGLNTDERMTYCSLATELGLVSAVFVPETYRSDDAYDTTVTLRLDSVKEPLVAWPHHPLNIYSLSATAGIPLTHCFIGTCSGVGLTGLREAATVLAGQSVAPAVTLIVTPQSQSIYRDAVREGLVEIIVVAGGIVTTPGCGACLASHSGVLAKGDVCVSTGNRNFRGRMGDPDAAIYLASPRVAAAAALRGEFVMV